jgi:hypothetical protein
MKSKALFLKCSTTLCANRASSKVAIHLAVSRLLLTVYLALVCSYAPGVPCACLSLGLARRKESPFW